MKVIAVLLFALILSSCVNTGLGLINGIAKSGKYSVSKDISYGPHEQNKLDLYLPKTQKISATIVFFYGGCWGQCSALEKHHYLFVAEALTQQGYAVVIPDYRKYPDVKFKEIMEDAENAVLWTGQNSQKYAIENKSLFIMGHSAGAQIGAMLVADEGCLEESLLHVGGFIGLAGPYDFYPFSDDYMYQLFSSENDYFNSQPINYINGNEPPFLLIHGKNDKKVSPKNAINISAKLSKFQVDHELIMPEKKSHIGVLINMAKPFRKNALVLSAINDFVGKHKKTLRTDH